MYYGLLLHTIIAFFMFTNTKIFNEMDNDDTNINHSFLKSTFSAGNPRLQSKHGKLYFIFMIASIGFFLAYHLGGLIVALITKNTNQEKRQVNQVQEESPAALGSSVVATSSNIYQELSIEDLKAEYEKNKAEKFFCLEQIHKSVLDGKKLAYFLDRLNQKSNDIKQLINKWLIEAKISEANDTLDAFDKVAPLHKTDSKHRMKQLYSYDIKDSETFESTFEIEEKIKPYMEKAQKILRERRESKN
jgi:ATP-dependent Lon protease